MLKNRFIRNTLILFIGAFVCKIIGAVYRIPLSNILGAEGIGIYQLVFPIYALLLVIVSGGVVVAESRLIAVATAKNDYIKCRQVFSAGFLLTFCVGLIFSIGLYFGADFFANLIGNAKCAFGFKYISLAILFSGLISSFRGYYQGLQNMLPTAISQIVEQVVKLALGIFFSLWFLRFGIVWGVVGAIVGVLFSEIIALAYFLIYCAVNNKKSPQTKIGFDFSNGFKSTFFEVIKWSFPIMIGSIAIPLTITVDNFLVVNLLNFSGFGVELSTSLFGLQSGMINSIINFPTVLSVAIAVSIIPAISSGRISSQRNSEKISNAFQFLYLLILPCAIGIYLLAPLVIKVLYPTLLDDNNNLFFVACNLLQISSVSIFYIAFMQVSNAILQGIGKIYLPAINLLFACTIKIIITIILVQIPSINILGCAIANVICYLLAGVLNMSFVKKYTQYKISFKISLGVFVANIIMGLFCFACAYILGQWLSVLLTLSLTVFLSIIVYFFILYLLKIVNYTIIYNWLHKDKSIL